MKRRTVLPGILAGIIIGLAVAGCGTQTSGTVRELPPVQAALVQGDLTYQDVLEKGGFLQFAAKSPDASRIWLGTHSGLYASANDKLWVLSSPDVGEDDVAGLFIDPADPRRIFIGGQGICKFSSDGGQTWKTIDQGLPKGANIRSFAGIRQKEKVELYAYVAEDGIYQFTDGGQKWEKWLSIDQEVYAMAFHPAQQRLYLVTQSGLLSVGEEPLRSEPVPDVKQVYSLAIDSQDDALYLSTDIGVLIQNGSDWTPHTAKAPEQFVLLGPGFGSDKIVAVGESAALYTLTKGKWRKWE
ncbi:WD40/YVTN/BNR-like repeat-containing protein [Brevibacillus sp. B_LB10_24]|uniref:WD40/YVTN/BNR-like repeat-containing protein n=1 Tax=Brevibacillus sp. B_LB10_24 TaxID=3380645 RepID=UPI0038B84D13